MAAGMKNALEYLGHNAVDNISGVAGIVVAVTMRLYQEPTVTIEREYVLGNGELCEPLTFPIAQVTIDYDTMPKKNPFKTEKVNHE